MKTTLYSLQWLSAKGHTREDTKGKPARFWISLESSHNKNKSIKNLRKTRKDIPGRQFRLVKREMIETVIKA